MNSFSASYLSSDAEPLIHTTLTSYIYFSAKRGMNGDIILRKVKLAPGDVASMVDCMDCGRLDPVELKSLYEYMPTDEEMQGLTAYLANAKDAEARDEAINLMTPCEQYMVAMKDLKDSEKKFQSIIFLAEFKNKMDELKYDVDHLDAACEELRTSKRFQTLLAMILTLVNKINTGDEGGALADGFTLDSLPKLSEVNTYSLCVLYLRWMLATFS